MTCDCADEPTKTPLHRLYIGSSGACAVAADRGFAVIASVCEFDVQNKSVGVVYHFAKTADDDANIAHATRALRQQICAHLRSRGNRGSVPSGRHRWSGYRRRQRDKLKILVRCEDGHNRSCATLALIALQFFRVPLRSFLSAMQAIKPCANPCAGFLRQLAVYEQNIFKCSASDLSDTFCVSFLWCAEDERD